MATHITACPKCGAETLKVVCHTRTSYRIERDPEDPDRQKLVAETDANDSYRSPLYAHCTTCGQQWAEVEMSGTYGIYSLRENKPGGYADYWDSVTTIAQECIDNAREDNPDADINDARELIWEAVDGTSWVIDTAQAKSVEEHSQNWPDLDELGEFVDLSAPDVSFGSLYTAAAFEAMNRDVDEKLGELFDAMDDEEEEDEEEDAGTDA